MSDQEPRVDRTRRRLLQAGAGLGAGIALPHWRLRAAEAPAVVTSSRRRPAVSLGVASGDVTPHSAMLWSRADRPARMLVDYAPTESFRLARRVRGPEAIAADDYTARVDLRGLPAGEAVFYRVRFQSLEDPRAISEPVTGRLRTPGAGRGDVRFLWSGDTAGQGWGIDESRGGMRIYETMRRLAPDFFIHSGDTVYADGPLEREVALPDGDTWRNRVTEEKSKVAETLDEFRGQYRYNLLDGNVRAFNAEVPQLWQWDDHETVNNWYPGEILDDPRYTVKSVDLLAARARRAFLEYAPLRPVAGDPQRIHRRCAMGPHLELFFLDKRSYRGPNTRNRQAARSADTALLGGAQIAWLKRALLASRSTWKVIASDMPVGLIVSDGEAFENGANGDGPPLGREHDIAELLRFIHHNDIRNVVWLTADVHYTAAHYYDPAQARFADFRPFWEFVTGPLHAGTFGPNVLDPTFGPQVMYQKAPPEGQRNLPPSAGLQFFGDVRIDGGSGVMTVALRDLEGAELFSVTLEPERG